MKPTTLAALAFLGVAGAAMAAEITTTELRSGTWRLTFKNDTGTPIPTPPTSLNAKIVDEATNTIVWSTQVTPGANPYSLAVPDTGNTLVNQSQVTTSPAGYERHYLVIDATSPGLRITDEIPFLVKRIRQLPAATPTP